MVGLDAFGFIWNCGRVCRWFVSVLRLTVVVFEFGLFFLIVLFVLALICCCLRLVWVNLFYYLFGVALICLLCVLYVFCFMLFDFFCLVWVV